jgi:hypothetical protein
MHMLLRLGIELPQLLRSTLLGLRHLLSSPLESATNLYEQVGLRIVIHRAIDTLDPPAALGECIDPKPLMDIVAGQAVGGRDHHAFHSRQSRAIAEASKPRALQGGPAIAVIAGEMLLGNRPVGGRRDVVTQTAQLLCDRWLLWLTARGDTDVESDFHGFPPADAMAQAAGLRCLS